MTYTITVTDQEKSAMEDALEHAGRIYRKCADDFRTSGRAALAESYQVDAQRIDRVLAGLKRSQPERLAS
ncbi:hypothetical protein [Propionicicella superfundia]|uniref:hypothetical protein n=1 Tax=Propionicicella superfundia TaxID=348582 RepID=UPI00048DA616|nr:hypothetical protein [Propionicicella superfundia]